MLLLEEMVTSLLIGSLTYGTHFLIILLPVVNVNSVIFTLISSFHNVVLGHLLVHLSAAFVSLLTHCL